MNSKNYFIKFLLQNLFLKKSNWLEYLRKSEEFSSKIVISGRSRKEPWSKENFLIIAKAHKQIINSNQPHAVYSTVETNWVHAYIK